MKGKVQEKQKATSAKLSTKTVLKHTDIDDFHITLHI